MAKSKSPRGKGTKSTAASPVKPASADEAAPVVPGDPLRAFPADPPAKNVKLLIVSAILFAAWFGYLVYVALAM